ncbi:hypothetical protein O7621_02315 [Solwaraspora sp. WMMD937]|uniref:hypothetical protein n=1 Tax=Solwaraspora sp. WMMD937 TaxID=3016090 RepID=UPI00249CAF6D|nr:hypothetical protein [Solwaraspora sp. WMMD937]WFE22226.1 hypothetical protein O7621_02315 [Solwaraspora sp. WMMD937]
MTSFSQQSDVGSGRSRRGPESHGGAEAAATGGWSLTDSECKQIARAHVAKAAANSLSQRELAEQLLRLPAHGLVRVQRNLKVRTGASMQVIAQAMQTRLVKEPEQTVAEALHDALSPAVHATAATSALSEGQLSALLRGDLTRVDYLAVDGVQAVARDIQIIGRTSLVRAVAWSSMVSSGHAGAVAALAWLIAEPPDFWSDRHRQVAAEVWLRVRRRCPMLPENPVSLTQLTELLAAVDPDAVSTVAEQEDSLPSADQLLDLVQRGERIEAEAESVRSVELAAVDLAFARGVPPSDAVLARIAEVAAGIRNYLDEAVAVVDLPSAESLADVRQQLIAASEAEARRARITRIRRLTEIVAPDFAAEQAAQVADFANSVTAETDSKILAGLDALVTAIEVGPEDLQGRMEKLSVAQAALPQLAMAMTYAASGLFTFAGVTGAGSHDNRETADSGRTEDGSDASGKVPGDGPRTSGTDDVPDPLAGAPAVEPVTPTAAAENQPQTVEPPVAERGEGHMLQDQWSAGLVSASSAPPDLDEVLATLDLRAPAPVSIPGPRNAAAYHPVSEVTDRPSGPEAVGEVDHVDADGQYASLLGDQQYALVYWLVVAEGQPAPVAAAHRLIAHAAAIRSSAGPNAAAFAETVQLLDANSLADRPDAQMLVFAASVRAGLLSPTAGAAGPLRELTTSVVKAGPAVEALAEALLGAIYSGVYLNPRRAGVIAEAAEVEAAHEQLARSALHYMDSARSRTIRYQAATELWQSWMAPSGYLGAPLSVVARGSHDKDDLTFVRDRIGVLRSRQTLDAQLDRDTRGAGKRKRRIEARAREKLLAWTGEVTDLLVEWVAATENLSDPAARSWMADPITELRTKVNMVRESAIEQLLAGSGSGDVRREAVVDASVAMLREALALLDGSASLKGAEQPSERLLNGMLALAPDLPLDARLQPRRQVSVVDVTAAFAHLNRGTDGWEQAFEARAARGDQVGAQILVEMLRPYDPHFAQGLTSRREAAIGRSTERLDDEIARLVATLDSDRRFGRLTAELWSDLSARVRAYSAGVRAARQDFDVMLDELRKLDEERAAEVSTAVGEVRRLLDEVPDEAAATRIASRIDEGDLTTAHEYLETVRHGRSLPGPHDDVDHLGLFYSGFLAALTGDRASRRSSPLVELRRAIEAGRNPSEGRIAVALSTAGIDLSQLDRPRNAATRIGQWTVLTDSKNLDGSKVGAVKSVLEQLGFLARDATVHNQIYDRWSWIYLSSVRATSGNALIPAFGTAMSPSGDTLRVLVVRRSPTPQELVELLRNEPPDHAVVVLYLGILDVTARRDLATAFRSGRKLPAVAVVDEVAFAYLVAQPEPGRHITMAITLPFTWATPFTPDVAGLVPQEMFYGRTDERDRVVDMMGPCIVYGGRQLGKSALLRAAARDFEDGGARYAIYQSIYKVGQATPVDAVWTTLWPRLADKGIVPRDLPSGDIAEELTNRVSAWIGGRSGRQLLLLLDESDSFLDADATDGKFAHVTRFKDLMESTGRAVKVVFAGLHQTARFERLANHPLAHFGDPVCVGPLAPQPAYDLLTRPLEALGLRFENHDHASRVLALANNQPALIQLFGAQLLRNLQRTPASGVLPQAVTLDDIEAVWADASLRTSFRKRFDWTLNLDPRYKVIAYSVAYHTHDNGVGSALTAAQLRAECEHWWLKGFAAQDMRAGEFRALLDECVDLGVLSYIKGRYRLRTPNLHDLLGTQEEVDEFLAQADSMPLPESFDASMMRPQFGSGVTRGPLTSSQIADLLAPRRQVRLIVGSAALTVERCAKVLQEEKEKAYHSGRLGTHLRDATPMTLRHACQQATLKSAGGHAVVYVDVSDATVDVARETWRTAREIIATRTGGTLGIVLISGVAQAPLWLEAQEQSDMSCGVTGLRRYGRTDLRLWLTDTTLPFQDDATRNELLAVTGGWPVRINKVAEALTEDHELHTRTDPLDRVRAEFSSIEHAEALVAASGVRSDEVLRQAWETLVAEHYDDRIDPETIAWALTEHAVNSEVDRGCLTEEYLAQTPYKDAAGVVEVLRILGLLILDPADGLLHLEPVMTAATRAVGG